MLTDAISDVVPSIWRATHRFYRFYVRAQGQRVLSVARPKVLHRSTIYISQKNLISQAGSNSMPSFFWKFCRNSNITFNKGWHECSLGFVFVDWCNLIRERASSTWRSVDNKIEILWHLWKKVKCTSKMTTLILKEFLVFILLTCRHNERFSCVVFFSNRLADSFPTMKSGKYGKKDVKEIMLFFSVVIRNN